jgi:UDP-N-acetylglucosamine 2-epimerase
MLAGTRPELIKLALVEKKLRQNFDVVFIFTGQNFESSLGEKFIDELQIKVDIIFENPERLYGMDFYAHISKELESLLDSRKFDAAIIYGDTFSCLSAINLAHRGIKIFHCEAGNRCFDKRVPEEINRKIIDHISDYNFVLSEYARNNLLREGYNANGIFKVGYHTPEVYREFKIGANSEQVLSGLGLDKDSYVLCSIHRKENLVMFSVDEWKVFFQELSIKLRKKIIVSTHPRLLQSRNISELNCMSESVHYYMPFGLNDYISLIKHSYAVISDSGSVAEDGSFTGASIISPRVATERPEGIENAWFTLADISRLNDIDYVCSMIEADRGSSGSRCTIKEWEGQSPSSVISNAVLSFV